MQVRILHIDGKDVDGKEFELLVVNPKGLVRDYLMEDDEILSSKMVELEGDWFDAPEDKAFENI